MNKSITVIICTHNPRRDYLSRVLNALKLQTLPMSEWELILIDNASKAILSSEIDLRWHSNARHVREETLGLTPARIRGINEASNEVLVFVDDDNVLDPNYLINSVNLLQDNPNIGAIGGKSLPEFEVNPKPWFYTIDLGLGCRDLGNETYIGSWKIIINKSGVSIKNYPKFAPIGSGMVLRKKAGNIYYQKIINSSSLVLDRTGEKLTSGGDNDIIMTLLDAGWEVGYFPQLTLQHLIPKTRLTKKYLAQLKKSINTSWIKVLDIHGIRPWGKIPQWSVLPRKIKAYLTFQAWKDEASYILWQGACGIFEGQAELK